MKIVMTCLLVLVLSAIVLPGCAITEKFSGSKEQAAAVSAPEKATFKCTHCQSDIDVTDLQKGCDVKCPACSNVCTY